MKTSQESEVLSSGKEVNEVQEILDFTRNFIDSHGRFPKLRELPAKKGTIVCYFGSFEALLQIARIGEKAVRIEREDLPLRKSKEVRYCRYCGKEGEPLPRHRWFFHNDECEEKFRKKNEEIPTGREIKRPIKKPRRKIWAKCGECRENCKIYLPEHLQEPKAKITCKASLDYQRLSEIYTYPFKKK